MIQARKLVATAMLGAVALVAVAFIATPFGAGARASAGASDLDVVAGDRIGGAFASITSSETDPAITAAAARVAKGDLGAGACAEAVWPNIDATCLTTADGSPAAPVRTITIGYQSDAATTVLVRIPTTDVASR